MATIVRMPEVLAGTSEAALASWLVKVGDRVEIGDPIAEIETEKALVEYSAESAGIMGRTLVTEGVSIEVGAPIAVLIIEGEQDAEIEAALGAHLESNNATGAGAATQPAAPFSAPAAGATTSGTTPGHRTSAPDISQDAPEKGTNTVSNGSANTGTRIHISPLARQLAKRHGLELSGLSGTGPGGRIVRRDLDAVLAMRAEQKGSEPIQQQPAAASPAPVTAQATAPAAPRAGKAPDGGYVDTPHSGMRRAIARRLTESKSTVPHFYLVTECRVDALLALRKSVNETSKSKVSLNDFVVKAAASAFTEVPEANVIWTNDALRRFDAVDISIAVATDGGLLTPVVKDAGRQTLTSISNTIAELAGRAREGRLRQNELEGGSFTVTNLGMYGTTEFTAILNPPQSGILAVGAAHKQAIVGQDDQLCAATVMKCTLSVDHRAVDGALAARWLSAFTQRIENPLTILI